MKKNNLCLEVTKMPYIINITKITAKTTTKQQQ